MLKRTTRLSALLLALVMVLSVVMAVPRLTYAADGGFPDVGEGDTFYKYIDRVKERGFYDGDEYGNFNAEDPMTRAQVAKVLVKALGLDVDEDVRPTEKPFEDVPADHQLAAFIKAAKDEGIFEGYKGNFDPEGHITRGQAAAVVVRTLDFKLNEDKQVEFSDVPADHTFADDIAVLASQGVVTGDAEGKFNPEADVTRGQFAKYLVNGVTFKEADDAVAALKAVLADEDATQEMIDAAYAKAVEAKNALLEDDKKEKVTDAIDELLPVVVSISAIDANTISVTFDNEEVVEIELEEALVHGQTEVSFVYNEVEYTATLDEAYVDPAVVEAEELAAALEAYEEALAAVEEEDYTVDSWDAYQAVVEANVVTEENTVEEINAATAAILEAQENLETELEAAEEALEDAILAARNAVEKAEDSLLNVDIENAQELVDVLESLEFDNDNLSLIEIATLRTQAMQEAAALQIRLEGLEARDADIVAKVNNARTQAQLITALSDDAFDDFNDDYIVEYEDELVDYGSRVYETIDEIQAVLDVVNVEQQLLALPVADDITLDHEDVIVAAREAFDALTYEQKTNITPAATNRLVTAEAALVAAFEEAAIEAAIEDLNDYLDPADYEENAELLESELARLETYLEGSDNIEDVARRLEAAKVALDRIESDADLDAALEAYKEARKADLDNYVNEEDYTENADALAAAIEGGKEAIDAATTDTEAYRAREAAYAVIDEILTDDEVEALADATAALVKAEETTTATRAEVNVAKERLEIAKDLINALDADVYNEGVVAALEERVDKLEAYNDSLVFTETELRDALEKEELDTIILGDNIETEGLQLNGKNVAFDLNGKTLNTAKLEVKNSTVVFGDSSGNGGGTLATDGSSGVINAVNSNVTIENGQFVSI